jgi:hypothetical protein
LNNRGLAIPEFGGQYLDYAKTPVHAAHSWFRDLLSLNGVTEGKPLVLDTTDDKKAVWVWAEYDASKEHVVKDTYDRGTAYVSGRTTYKVGVVDTGYFAPDVVFAVGRSFVGQDGNMNLSPLAGDRASCGILAHGEWEEINAYDLQFASRYEGTEIGDEIDRQNELVKNAMESFIDYIR